MKEDNMHKGTETLNGRIYPEGFIANELKKKQLSEIDDEIKNYDNKLILSSIISCLLFIGMAFSGLPVINLVLGVAFGLHAFRSYNFRELKKSSYVMMEKFYRMKDL